MCFTYAQFIARFPELTPLDEDYFNEVLTSAAFRVNQACWGDKYCEGLKLMTAHIISAGSNGGSATGVLSCKVGDLETKYGGMSGNFNEITSSSYGAQFNTMQRSLGKAPFYVSC